MSKPLYQLTSDYRALVERVEDGEVVDDETLSALVGELEHKGLAVVHVLRELELDIERFKTEEQRLAARRRAHEANREKLREYVKRTMLDHQVTKLKAGTFSITVSEGPEHVVVDDETKLPEAFVRVKREPNKSAILEAYKKDGELVAGTHIERSVTLRIR